MNWRQHLLAVIVAVFFLPSLRALEWEKSIIAVEAKPGADTVLVAYLFKNTGTSPVQILEITTSCSCTDATPSSSEIAAGCSGSVDVVFTIGRRTGAQEKEIFVRTNDAREPVKLVLKVQIPPPHSPTPTTQGRGPGS